MTRLFVPAWCLLALAGGWLSSPLIAQDKEPDRHALLVGCTKYPLSKIRALSGPANDIKLMRALLTKRFGIAEKNVTQLLGWPDDPKQRPTCANIVAGLKDLVAKAGPGTQIVILLAGHGMQAPIPEGQGPLDPKNFEPDGMDEYFLPADAEPLDERTIKNGLKDDEMGTYLRAMRDKGAAVWVVFDCCHSGTMTRSAHVREVPRSVKPADLGISEKAVQDAIRRAQAALKKARMGEVSRAGPSSLETGPVSEATGGKGIGSLVAFYAAQPFEETFETLRPDDAEDRPEHYYGLLSTAIVKVLTNTTGPLSYNDLGRKVLAFYAAERGARAPTPFIEGDVKNAVLGTKPLSLDLDIVLRGKKGKLSLNVGLLRGVTQGSILSVHPPAGEKGKELLGYVTVTRSTPLEAEVIPCAGPGEEDKKPAVQPEALPDLARCKLVTQDLGDMRLKVALRAATEKDNATVLNLEAALERMNKDIRALWTLVKTEADADWVLWVEGGKLRIRRGEGQVLDVRDKAEAEAKACMLEFPSAKEYGNYDVADPAKVVLSLERDLQAIYTWQNLWRITCGAGAATELEDLGLKLEILRLGEDGKVLGPIEGVPRLYVNQPMRFILRNTGYKHLSITLLSMDGDCGISVIPFALPRGKTFDKKVKLDPSSWGKEGVIVLAVPVKETADPVNFEFLEQDPLTLLRRSTARGGDLLAEKDKKIKKAPQNPFTALLRTASLGQGKTRALRFEPETTPNILSQAWITLPVPK